MPGTPGFEPDFVSGLKEIFEQRIVFNRLLGLRIGTVSAEGVTGHIEMRNDLIGHYTHQRLHGGVVSAGLDAMGGLAVMAAIGARHMDEPALQRLRGHDGIGRVQVEGRHAHRQRHDQHVQPAGQLVGRAFLGFDELLGLVQRVVGDHDGGSVVRGGLVHARRTPPGPARGGP